MEQARVSAETTRAVLALWMSTYEPSDQQAWQALLAALRAMVSGFRNRSSRSAVAYYLDSRGAARVPGLYVPPMAPEPPQELIEVTAQITGAHAYGRSLTSGMTETVAKRNAGVQIAGAMARIALDAGRETILHATRRDRQAIGWARVSDANPCAFCAMLVSRGAVYDEDTASFQTHAHCACIAAPVWNRSEAWLGHSEDLYQQWKRVTQGESGKDALRAWRQYWNHRNDS